MSKDTKILVDQVSVVLAARYHNPSIINPDFLQANRITSDNWSVSETLTTPGFSQTRFDNGIALNVDENRCTIIEEVGDAYRDFYAAHEMAAAYVSTLPHLPYHAVGMNWRLHLPKNNPKPWLIRRFLKPGAWLKSDPAIDGAVIKFAMRFAESVCFLKVSAGESDPGPEEKIEAIIVDCNFHYAGPFERSGVIKDIIGSGNDCQAFLKSETTKLLTGRLA